MERANHKPESVDQRQSDKTPPSVDKTTSSALPEGTRADFKPASLTTDHVIMLQRQIGNRATRNILNKKSVQRSVSASVVQRDSRAAPVSSAPVSIDDEFSESYSESEEEERDVPMSYEEEEESSIPDVATLREEMNTLRYYGLADKYGWPAVKELCDHLFDVLIDEGEDALSEIEMAALSHRFKENLYPHGKREQIIEASPTLSARAESEEAEERHATYEHIMNLLRDESMQTFQSHYLLMARQYYFHGVPDDFPYADELKTLVETDAWSWLLADGIDTRDDVFKLFEARRKLKDAQDKTVDQEVDPISAATEGTTKTALTGSRLIGITEGIDTLTKIDEETKGKDLISRGMENLALSISQKVFAPISIGHDLLKAFGYHKIRRDGYYSAMERSGVKGDGSTEVKPDTAADVEKIRLGQVAYYAYKKTRRAFWSTITKMMLKVVKWIAHAITVLSGGTTAVVTGAIALSADITRSLMGIGSSLKGIYKTLAGKRGTMRKKNAMELVELATGGNEDAIQTIWEVNPFDEVKTATKKVWNTTGGLGVFGGHITELPKPESLEDFKQQLKDGYYSERKVQMVLVTALKNTMSST